MKTRSRRAAHGTITRRRAGKGFSYRDADGQRVDSPEVLARIEALAIPPAWRNVRIAASQRARVQATGIDSAGRKQYLYHSTWRERQEARKFDRAVALARRLPAIRRAVTEDLRGKHGPKEQALAAALRIVDRLGVRVGNRRYARQHGSFGVTTIQCRHLRLDGDSIALEFPGKSGMQWSVELHDPDLAEYLRSLPKGAKSRAALGYEAATGFQRIGSESLNGYLRVRAGMGASAKDLRTWRGTVIAAESLARSGEQGFDAEEAWRRAIADAADWLHNTIAVARGSYVDPRLLLAYHEGRKLTTPGGKVSDAALAELLDSTPRTGPGT